MVTMVSCDRGSKLRMSVVQMMPKRAWKAHTTTNLHASKQQIHVMTRSAKNVDEVL